MMKTTSMRPGILVLVVLAGCGDVVDSKSGGSVSITSISPDHGSIAGGTEVTITGSNLDSGDAQVLVGGFLAPSVTVVDGKTLKFMSPPAIQEGDEVDITVFNESGHATLSRAYRINEQPIVVSISPSRGRGMGGTVVTITGRGFQDLEAGDATVTIAGVAATNVTVTDDKTLMATLGSAPMAPAFEFVDVDVENANGKATLSNQFQLTQPGLIALNGNNVFYVDVRTGRSTQLTRLDRNARRCGPTPTGTMLGWARNTTNSNRELVSFDPFGKTVTALGGLTGNRSVSGLTFNGATLYGVTTDNNINPGQPHVNNLVSINPTNGALTNIGAALALGTGAGNGGAGIAVRDASTIWLIRALNGTLDHINITTGARTVGPTLTNGPANGRTRSAAIVGTTLYVNDRNTAQLFEVNTTTGAVARLITTPQTSFSAICEAPPTF